MEQRWSTLSQPVHEQFAFWREVVCRAFVDLLPQRRDRGPFAGTVRSWPLSEITVSEVASQAQRVLRGTREIDASPKPVFYVNLQLRGEGKIRQGGRCAHLRPGDFAVVDTLRPYELAFESEFTQLSFHLPQSLLAPHLPAPPEATAVRIAASTPVGRLVSGYLRSVARCAPAADPALALGLAQHVGSLIGLGLGAASPTVASGMSRTRAAHLQAAHGQIELHLGDPNLTADRVAAYVGISTRHLQRLFAERGTSFGRWVLERRLQSAHRDLADPAFATWTITQLAFRWGFGSSSQFGRAFRDRYGCTPTNHRASTRSDTSHTTEQSASLRPAAVPPVRN